MYKILDMNLFLSYLSKFNKPFKFILFYFYMIDCLDKIKFDILQISDCDLKNNSKNLVFDKGNFCSEIMFIGEAPGKIEDEIGIPFSGESGENLNKQLENIGINPNNCYFTNIVKYRPENNRKPKISEINKYSEFLIRQINIVKPKVIIPLGNTASKFCLSGFSCKNMNKVSGMDKIHGKFFEINSYTIFPMYHPSSNVSSRIRKENFIKDFLKLKEFLKEINN